MRTLLALTLTTLLAFSADTKPAAVMQMHSPAKLLREIREAANIVAGETGRKAFDDALREALGEKGFQGLDLNKPLTGYAVFDKTDIDKVAFILLVPITKQEDFFDLLKRAKLDPKEVEGQKGIWKLGQFEIPQDDKEIPVEVTMRIIDRTAYVGFNASPDKLDPLKVHTADQIYDPEEAALFSYRQFNDRIPESVLRGNFKYLDQMLTKLKADIGEDGPGKTVFAALEKLVKGVTDLSLNSKETGSRVLLDTATGELTFDSYYVPKPDTLLAKLVAARTPSVNQFGRLADESLAAGVFVQMPVGMKDVQDLIVFGLEEAIKELAKEDKQMPEYGREIATESLKGLIRTAKSGNWDLAVILSGPDKDGHFTAAAAMSYADAQPLEKLIRKHHKSFDAEVRDLITFDTDTVSKLNIHSFEFDKEARPGVSKIFGDAKLNVVFGSEGIYVAIGPNAKDMLKTAIAGKPKAAKPFDILVNPKKVSRLAAVIDPETADKVEQVIGNEDYTYSALSFSVTGGEALRFKTSLNLKIIPRMVYRAFEMNR